MKNRTDVSADNNSSRQEGSLPFFARFLEGQGDAGAGIATTKYPSDWDEMDQTLKYPSDSDEGEDR